MKGRKEGLLVLFVVMVAFVGSIVLAPVSGYAAGPAVKVSPYVAEVQKSVSVDITGTGFEPGKEVRILLTDEDGMQTDIGYALDPAPKANKGGAWISTWKVDEFIKAKLIKPGAFVLTVTDDEFKPITETVAFFKAAAKKPKAKDDKKNGKEKKEKKEKK